LKNKTARRKSADLPDSGDHLPEASSSATNLKVERSSEDDTSSMDESLAMENFTGISVSGSTELPSLDSSSTTVQLTSAHVLRDVDRLIGHLDLDDEEDVEGTETPAVATAATTQREGGDDDLFDPGNEGQCPFVCFCFSSLFWSLSLPNH